MAQETDFNGGATARFQSEELKTYRLDRKAPTLVVLLGLDTGLRIPLTQPQITLGRTDGDVLLHDEQISRRHAAIHYDAEKGTYSIVDLNSTNGTRVNLQQVTGQVTLADGDKIFMGSTVLKFVLQDELESEHGSMVNRWAFIDDLTGLPVKRRFYSQLRFEIHRALEMSEKLTLLMMDMDGLKKVNDAHGHSMGAFVISQVGRVIGEVIGSLGQACRFGGDEFVAYVLRHDKEKGLEVGERIRKAVAERTYEKDGKSVRVSISIGIAVLPDNARELEALNQAADEALYRAKAKGRNCVSE